LEDVFDIYMAGNSGVKMKLTDMNRDLVYRTFSDEDGSVKDLILICGDGVVESYQALFATVSPLLKRMFMAKLVLEDGGKRKDIVVVHLPDARVEAVENIVDLISCGEVSVSSPSSVQELKSLLKLLDMSKVTSFNVVSIPGEDRGANETEGRMNPNHVIGNNSTGLGADNFNNSTSALNISSSRDDSDNFHGFPVSHLAPIAPRNLESSIALGDLKENKKTFKPEEERSSTPKPPAGIPQQVETIVITESPNETDVEDEEIMFTAKPIGSQLRKESSAVIILPGYENVVVKHEEELSTTRSQDSSLASNGSQIINLDGNLSSEDIFRMKNPGMKRKSNSTNVSTVGAPSVKKSSNISKIKSELSSSTIKSSRAVPIVDLSSRDSPVYQCCVCKSERDQENRMFSSANILQLRNHVAQCLYRAGRLYEAVDPGAGNRDESGRPRDELGSLNPATGTSATYRCAVQGCWLQQRTDAAGELGYKVYAIHQATSHGILEQVLMEDCSEEAIILALAFRSMKTQIKNEAINHFEPVAKVQQAALVESGAVRPTLVPSIHQYDKEGHHDCVLCGGQGQTNKDGIGLSFKDVNTLKEHYSRCLYVERLDTYSELIPPGSENAEPDGRPRDALGRTAMYRCPVQGCWLQKKAGPRGEVCYKVLAIHMASQHGVLEQLLLSDPRPALQELLAGLKQRNQASPGVARCRFPACASLQFKADSKRELKLHYAAVHYKKYFPSGENGVSPGFTRTGGRAVCEACSAAAGKPVYIQGDREAMVGHLVVKHDTLRQVLVSAEFEDLRARYVISDVYPE